MNINKSTICIALFTLNGCYAVYQPTLIRKPLQPRETSRAQEDLEWPVFVVVDGPARNDMLAHDLDVTHLFRDVRPSDKKKRYRPDLVVETIESVNQANPLPFLTIMTLGIFPTIWRDQFGHRFIIRNPNTGQQVEVQFPVHTLNVMGWLAAPLRLFPGWSDGETDPRDSDLYAERFRLALLAKQSEIEKLVQPASNKHE